MTRFEQRRTDRIQKYTDAGLWGKDMLHDLLARNVTATPEREAVVDQPNKSELMGATAQRLSLAQLEAASSATAHELARRGVGSGDAVILQLPNTSELIVLYYALSKLGAIIAPIAVLYGQQEITHFARELDPCALITVDELRGARLAEQARTCLPGTPVWSVTEDLDVFAGKDDEPSPEPWARDANRTLTIAWTSGTTGTPKGVPRSHNMWMCQGRLTCHPIGLQDGDRLLSPFPMINMAALGGFLFPSALNNCTLVLHHPLEVPLYLQQLQDERISYTLAPPPLLNRLAQQPALWQGFDFSALRAIGTGSVPLSPAMIDTFETRFATPILNFYGSNEGVGLISTPETAANPQHRAVLFPRIGVEGIAFESYAPDVLFTKVVDPDTGEEVKEPGVPGELCVDGPGVFDGYHHHDNADVFTEDGFFRSGDLVQIDPDEPSHYRIVGRCKDIINRGGVKLSPAEIDAQLEGIPGLAEAAACPVRDDDLGERVCACVVLADGAVPPALEDLRAQLTARGLTRFKLPERLEIFDALPRNPLGKVVRGDLTREVAARCSAADESA